MFGEIATRPEVDEKFSVVEHIGKGFEVKSGTFLGRVISVAKSHAGVASGLAKGRGLIERTIEKVTSDE
jgi:hypothetical protein